MLVKQAMNRAKKDLARKREAQMQREVSEAFETLAWTVSDNLAASQKDFASALSRLIDLADEAPKTLGNDFIEKTEDLIPTMDGRSIDPDTFSRSLSCMKIITIAAKHGPEIVPDEWIQSVLERACPNPRYSWGRSTQRDQIKFFHGVLIELAQTAPKRIDEEAYSTVAEMCLIGMDGYSWDRHHDLNIASYRTLAVFALRGIDYLTPKQETKIREDAKGVLIVNAEAAKALQSIDLIRREAEVADQPKRNSPARYKGFFPR